LTNSFFCVIILLEKERRKFMGKYYKISEGELLELLANDIQLDALKLWGVDNWEGYGENFEETIRQYGSKCEDFYDCARILLSDYVEVED
jgi:hypothetical protein